MVYSPSCLLTNLQLSLQDGGVSGQVSPLSLGVKVSEEQVTPSRGRSGKEKAAGRREAVREKRSSGRGRRGLQAPGTGAPTRPPEAYQSDVDRVPSRGKSVR